MVNQWRLMWPTTGTEGDMMRRAAGTVGLLAAALFYASNPASAASFDCNARGLSRAEVLICTDPQLSRMDEQTARRVDGFTRRMNYGQYLGVRHWQTTLARQRNQCDADRACIAAHYRAQARFLDRLQSCLENRFARRACLRESLTGDQEASGTARRRGAAGAP